MKLIGSKISRKDKNELPENRIFGRIRDYGKSIWLTSNKGAYNWRIFQEVPALLFREDGLYRRDDRLRCSGLPYSLMNHFLQ